MKKIKIKFKAWNKEKKELADVVSINFETKEVVLSVMTDLDEKEEKKKVEKNELYPVGYGYEYPEKLKNVILYQYSGLRDKKKKEIYRGNIVNYLNKNWIVGFANGHFMLHGGSSLSDIYKYSHEDLWKALGKISKDEEYENPVEVVGHINTDKDLLNK